MVWLVVPYHHTANHTKPATTILYQAFKMKNLLNPWCRRKAWAKGAFLAFLVLLLWSYTLVGQLNILAQTGELLSKPSLPASARINSLPSTHRLADSRTCKPPTERRPPASLAPKVSIENVRKLAKGGYKEISRGSGNIPHMGPFLTILSRLQLENLSLSGSVAEIGVHHGHFTSFLFATARQGEDLVVADLFEDLQDLNVEHSGSGNKQKFLKGMQTYGLEESSLHTIFTGSSADLPFDWPRANNFQPFRLISVDGGHTASLTFNDLQIGFCNLLPGGILVLDDFFHGNWPGVTEGFFQLLLQGPDSLKQVKLFPFLVCKGKILLTNDRNAYETFYNGLLDQASDLVKPSNRGHTNYELNGIPYLMCMNLVEDEHIHEKWESLIF